MSSKQSMSDQLQQALQAFDLDLTLISQIIQNDKTLLNDANMYGLIPIQVAAQRGSTALIRLLIELGGDIEAIDNDGKTPVIMSCLGGSLYAVHTFKECGANMSVADKSGRTLMHHAAVTGAVHILHYLHDHCGLPYDQKDLEGYTPMHMAVWNRNTQAVRYLLKKKCKASTTNSYGSSSLTIAANTGSRVICRLLIFSTKENLIVKKDGNGLTPLDHANREAKHIDLAHKMVEWTASRLHPPHPLFNKDLHLYYTMMLAPGLSLITAMLLLIHLPYLLLSVPLALLVIVFGFFGTIINHRLPHDAQYQNPGAFGAFISGLILTLICYFAVVFPCLWPHNFVWFCIVAIDYLAIIYLFWKIEHTDPGFDQHGKAKSDASFMTILDIAKQDSKSPIQYTFCTDCEIVIPEYTKHCKLCERCCNGFDHHCLWLRTCIGRGNHRLFVIFLATLVLDNMLFVRAGLSALITVSDSYNPFTFLLYGLSHERYMLFLMICNFATGIFGLMNLVFQLIIVSMKETTYFDYSGKAAYGKRRKSRGNSFTVRLKTLRTFFLDYDRWFNDRLQSRNALLV